MPKKLTQSEAIYRFKLKHGERYDYSNVVYVNNSTKVEIICPNHGSFWQSPTKHMSGRGCPDCGKNSSACTRSKTTADVVSQFASLHGDKYDYSFVDYSTNSTPVKIICPDHGEFLQSPSNHLMGKGCPECAVQTRAEKSRLGIQSVIEQFEEVHAGAYDYSKVDYKNDRTNVEIICPKHGSFFQTPSNHKNGYGCRLCAIEKKSVNFKHPHDEVISKFRSVHGKKYDYSNMVYEGSGNKVEIVCPDHGSFWQAADSHIAGCGCPSCSTGGGISRGEADLIEYVTELVGDIVVGDRSVISPYELDIYIPSRSIAIEYNGVYWHSTACKDDTSYHLRKTQMCEETGIRLIHIYEDEWLTNSYRVKEFIASILDHSRLKKLNARSCSVGSVDAPVYRKFLSAHHINGETNSSVRLGLYYSGEMVAVMGFVKQSSGVYNLNRYATSGSVRGGFSKLLSHFKKHYEWDKIVTYADRRLSVGSLYETCGFRKTKVSPPTFDYVKGGVRYNRQQFMKHKLKSMFPDTFDPNLTEKKNMELQGYHQIWNCGHIKFTMTAPDK